MTIQEIENIFRECILYYDMIIELESNKPEKYTPGIVESDRDIELELARKEKYVRDTHSWKEELLSATQLYQSARQNLMMALSNYQNIIFKFWDCRGVVYLLAGIKVIHRVKDGLPAEQQIGIFL